MSVDRVVVVPQSKKGIKVLALTGGGYRGLYTARVLEHLERRSGKPVGRCFDLIAGTSIGGILALTIAFEIPMSDVVRAFLDHGERIFPKRPWYAGLINSKYGAHAVGDLVASLFPEGATLADAKHALIIPTINLTMGRQQLIKSRHNIAWTRDMRYSVRDAAMATSAAPIYFPIVEFNNALFADGGLFANAPDLVALHEANMFLMSRDEDVHMLSIGTISSEYAVPHGIKKERGVLQWLRPTAFPLIHTIMAAQEQLAIQIVKHRLDDRYLRIDAFPSAESRIALGLDKAGIAAQKTLLALADSSISDLATSPVLDTFLNHHPQKWVINTEGSR